MSAPGPTNPQSPTNSSPASSGTTSEAKPDLAKRPNFEAVEKYVHEKATPEVAEKLVKWITLLKAWVEHAMVVVDGHEDALQKLKEDHEEKYENLEANAKDWENRADYVDGLLDIIADMDRGVKDMNDLRDHIDGLPFTVTGA